MHRATIGTRLDHYTARGVRPSAGSRRHDRSDYPATCQMMLRRALVGWRGKRADERMGR